LDWGNSQIIGDRAFSARPEVVSVLASGLINGLLLAGMQGCGKHFPGHGWVTADSHLALPSDERDLEEIQAMDIMPYEANNTLNMAAIMPAHVVYESVDTLPACFSSVWIQEELRGRLNYQGCVISDDLDMVGAHSMGDIRSRAGAALRAGCDAVLLCNTFEDMDELINEPLPELELNAHERHVRLKRLVGNPNLGPACWEDLHADEAYLQALAWVEKLKAA
ncbi:MAG: beta-N-acetylhexosaminidase, partial [Limnobacter sp.]|nr:beta-N-acetylhexosaminidase [Limnobacter sp.]